MRRSSLVPRLALAATLVSVAGGRVEAQAAAARDSATSRPCGVRVKDHDVSRWVEVSAVGMTVCVPPGGEQTANVWRGSGVTVMWVQDVVEWAFARDAVFPPRDAASTLYGPDGPPQSTVDARDRTTREDIGGLRATLTASYSGQTYWASAAWRRTPRPFIMAQRQGAAGADQLSAIVRSVRFTGQ